MCRVYHAGKIRRLIAARVAWALATGEWPNGGVKARNGIDDDLRAENLVLVKRGPRPYDLGKGGEASSLAQRQARNTVLINVLADNPGATVPMLSKLVGSPVSCVCTRLGKLSDMGLTCGPKCDAKARWDLIPAGQAVAATDRPVILDDLDKRILGALARSPMRQLELARRIEACPMTIKRRTVRLAERGLVESNPDARNRYTITDIGTAALGDAAPQPPERWIDPSRISAAAAKDVAKRGNGLGDDRSHAEMARHGHEVAAVVTTRRKRRALASSEDEFDLTG